MVDESTDYVLWGFTAPELAAQVLLLILLAVNMFEDSSPLWSVSRQIQIAVLAFLMIELAIPLYVYLDIRQNPERTDMIWVHVAAMPLLNIFGLAAYLTYRKPKQNG